MDLLRRTHRGWANLTSELHLLVTRSIVALSMLAAGSPRSTLAALSVFSIGLLVLGFATNFELNTSEKEIYAPFDSLARQHYDWIRDTFPQTSRTSMLVLHNADGSNVLTRPVMRQVFQALDAVRNSDGYNTVCNSGTHTDSKPCQIFSATRAWDHDAELFEQGVHSDAELAHLLSQPTMAEGIVFDKEYIMGNIETSHNGTITHAPTFFLYFLLNEVDEQQTAALEESMIQNLLALREEWQLQPDTHAQLDFFCHKSFADELLRAIQTDMILVPAIFVVMALFTGVVFYPRWSIALGAVITITMSLCTTLGIMFLAGIPFTSMTQLLPFLVFGVGLDDTFIITSEYLRCPDTTTITTQQRIRRTMAHVGTSITATTATTTLAFLLGLISTVPAVRWFCLYSFVAIVIDFIYQITYFVAVLVLQEEESCLSCCCPCTSQQQQDNQTPTALPTTPTTLPDLDMQQSTTSDTPSDVSDQSSLSSSPDLQIVPCTPKQKVLPETTSTHTPHIADRFMAWYSRRLLQPTVQKIVLVLFAALFAFCAYQTTLLTQEFDVMAFFPDDSYVVQALEVMQDNQDRILAVDIVFRDVNQSDPEIQQDMMDFIQEVTELTAFGAPPPICWVTDFYKLANAEEGEEGYNEQLSVYVNETLGLNLEDMSFDEQFQLALSVPAFQEAYGNDMVVDSEGNIEASRCRILPQNDQIWTVQQKINLFQEQGAITQANPINEGRKKPAFFTFLDLYMLWEFYSIAVDELIVSTAATVVAVSLVALVFIPHWSAVCFLVPTLSLVYIDLLGMMQLAGLHINVITYVCLLISIGLIVDFLMHVMLRYTESTRQSREGKVIDTLETMGSSILLGGMSTLLGVMMLVFSTSTLMRTIFTCLACMVALGVMHGLILLPVILSLVGPVSVVVSEENKAGESLADYLDNVESPKKDVLELSDEEQGTSDEEDTA